MARRFSAPYQKEPVSSLASWARNLAVFSVVAVLVSIIIVRFGFLEMKPALATFFGALACAGLSILVGLAAFVAIVGTEAPLLVPAAQGSVWAWLGAADARRLAPVIAAKSPPAGVAVATGDIGYGLEGFRESHRQAGEARRVCGLRERPPTDFVHYRTVSLIAALSTDPNAAQRFLVSELGELNAPDEATRRLRTTLRTFLDLGSSHAGAARVLGIHQKTVAYRVRRAEDLLGYRITDRRAPLEAALLLSAFLED